jgi:hypothetical protein
MRLFTGGLPMRKILLLTVAATVLALPAAAPAAGWNCSSSALLGQPVGAPVTANVGATTCQAASAGGDLPALPIPLQAKVISARTTLDGPSGQPALQTAGATGEVAGLTLDVPSDAPIPLPTTTVPDPAGGAPIDITQALRSLVPAATGPLLGVKLSSATASGRCAGGRPTLTGSSHVVGLTVAGQELPVDDALTQVITLVGTLDPSQLSPSALPAPLNALPASRLQPLLDALPSIPLQAPVQIKVTPGSQTRDADSLTQNGVHVFAAIAGQTVADLTLGQATIARDDVSCGQPVAAAQLACTKRKLALIDVLQRDGYVRLYGAADRKYLRKRVTIVSSWNGKVVARAKVRRDGTFTVKGKLPPRALRQTNRARYQARIGKERSLRLKLYRRMLVTRMASARGKVTIAGRVVLPLARPVRTITIKRRVSCTKNVVVKTLHPDAKGRFSVTLGAPPKGQAAVYRLATKVRKNTRNKKLFPTFTLPRAVALKQ